MLYTDEYVGRLYAEKTKLTEQVEVLTRALKEAQGRIEVLETLQNGRLAGQMDGSAPKPNEFAPDGGAWGAEADHD